MKEAGAALAAAQVLAFYKEPVRHRQRFTHGREPVEGGLHVIRFAQGRYTPSLMRDLSAAERDQLREAAAFFVRQVCLWEGASHYQVLCLAPGARREAIKEHYHALMALLHPDRLEASQSAWPLGAAQRVNLAHDALLDDGSRAAYDEGLRKSLADVVPGHAALAAAPVSRHRRSRERTLGKPAMWVGAMVLAVVMVQIWWMGEGARDPASYSGAFHPGAGSGAVPGRELPRFLSARTPAESQAAREAPAMPEIPLLSPLLQALDFKPAATALPAPREPGVALRPASESSVVSQPPAAAMPSLRLAQQPVVPAQQAPQEAPKPSVAPAPATVAPGANAAAPATTATGLRPGGMGQIEMEILMARIVSAYETGDVARLVGLLDTDAVGFRERFRIRGEFDEFFKTTRERRLKLNHVGWLTLPEGAGARGSATLTGEYTDQSKQPFVLVLEIQVDVVVRGGQPRIARLYLYPHEY